MHVEEISTIMPAVSHRFRMAFKGRIRSAGIDLSVLQFDAIAFLGQHDTANPHELAEFLERDRGQTTRLVNDLEALGLTTRTKSEDDGRFQHIGLTEKGRELLSCLTGIRLKLAREILGGLSSDECALFLTFLKRIRDQPLA